LAALLDERRKLEPAAFDTVTNAFPWFERIGVDFTAAAAREAPGRLRLDSRLLQEVEGVEPMPTPEWVMHQHLDMDMVETLKRAGGLEKARDLVDLCSVKSGMVSVERLRFANLHAAWAHAFYGQRIHQMNEKIQDIVGLGTGDLKLPCKGLADCTICSFRVRAEPKGIPRLLEKAAEALHEEVSIGNSQQILKMEPDPTPPDGHVIDPLQLALLELLTPANYVCDMSGAEASFDSLGDMVSFYRAICSFTLAEHGCQLVRMKNGFSKNAEEGVGGYKDLKLWLMLNMEHVSTLVEFQVHLNSFYELKKLMHLPYECHRGSFDHPHLGASWLRSDTSGGCCRRLTSLLCNLAGRRPKTAPAD